MSDTTELHVPETLHIETEQETPPPPTEGRPLSAREQMMETIARNREAQINKELAQYEVLTDEAHDHATGQEIGTTQAAREQEPPQPTHAEPAAAPIVSRETPAGVPTEHRRVVTIGANQFNVTDQEYDYLAQLGALSAQALAQQQQNPAVSPVQPAGPQREVVLPPSSAAVPTMDEETARAHYRRIAFGTEEDGAKALLEWANAVEQRAAQRAPHVDAQQIQSAAVMQAKQEIELERNLGLIGTEYPDIFNNRPLSQLAALQLHELRQRNAYFGRQQDNLSLYREACNNVRTAIGGSAQQPQPAGQAQPAPQAALEPERIERKRAAPRNPSSTAARAALTEAPTQQPNPSQVVEWMRRTRHQVPMN